MVFAAATPEVFDDPDDLSIGAVRCQRSFGGLLRHDSRYLMDIGVLTVGLGAGEVPVEGGRRLDAAD